jgi:hypothetical protein
MPGTRRRRSRFKDALKCIQAAEFDEAMGHCVQALNKSAENQEPEPPIVPNELDVDQLGRPTGGAESGRDVMEDILKQRRESARRNAMQRQSTPVSAESSGAVVPMQKAGNSFETIVEQCRVLANKGDGRALIFLADLFFSDALSVDARREVYAAMNADDAVSLYREAAKAEAYYVSAEALFKLGCIKFNGFDGNQDGLQGGVVDPNLKVARVLIEEAAAKREPR